MTLVHERVMTIRSSKPKWSVVQTEEAILKNLMADLKVSKTVAKILAARDLNSPEKARKFLDIDLKQLHDPFLLKDMDKACTSLSQAILNQKKICIYGDYDVDGAIGTSLLLSFFRDIGADVDFYIPCRQREGYSLNNKALKLLKDQGVDLLLTVDNGITSVAAVEYANEIGLDVIVTDHHQVGETLPPALAVVNPQRKDCAYPFKDLCGAGVAFKLIMALRFHLRESGFFENKPEPHLKSYFDLLCLSTICDVVPLKDENRLFVKQGLQHLAQTKRSGLIALKDVCGLKNKVTATDVGFKLGPRLNAAGRLDDASHGVRMLTATNYEEAYEYAMELDRLNSDRRAIEKQITEEALQSVSQQQAQSAAIVVFGESWHIGVVGIVASRLVENFHRPVFVLCETEKGVVKGSGRSFGNINLVQALNECAEHLQKFGGHEAAAGVTLAKDKVEMFATAFQKAVQNQMQDEVLQKEIWVDDSLQPEDVCEDLLREIEQLAPFGMGNETPLFSTQGWTVVSKRLVGENHLKLKLKSNHGMIDAIAFQKGEHLDGIAKEVDLLYELDRNDYMNQSRLQLIVKEIL